MQSGLGRDIRTIPNLITLSRIVLLLVAASLYFTTDYDGSAIVLAVIAGVTDYLDGAVARATGQVTRLGEILDLFCDLFYESFVLLVAVQSDFFPPWVLLLYLFREFWVTSIRRYVEGQGRSIPSSLVGKLKTNFIMWGFLPTFLALGGVFPSLKAEFTVAGRVMVGIGLFLSYLSGWGYTRAFVAAYVSEPPNPAR